MILNSNYKTYIDYKLDDDTSCEESGCNDEGICRCYTIYSVNIESVNTEAIIDNIYLQVIKQINSTTLEIRERKLNSLLYNYDFNIIDKYCIDRLCRHYRLYDPMNWVGEWENGYYGDEMIGINIKSEIFEKLSNDILKITKLLSLEDKINYLLLLEYGYIHKAILDKKYNIISVRMDDIILGQTNHLNDVLNKKLDFYNNTNYKDKPRGVAFFRDNKWRVVDGYHRLSSNVSDSALIIGVK